MDSAIVNLRHQALQLFQAGIDAADPYHSVKNCLSVTENHLEISLDVNDSRKKRNGSWQNIHLFAFGKAACKMIKAAKQVIPSARLKNKPFAVTNYENVTQLDNIDVMGAGHPLPDSCGEKAAEIIIDKLNNTNSDDLVLMMISGGGSALLSAPANGITLQDKVYTTDLLLSCGADIESINCVRKHLSRTKGGHLARLSAPADVHAFVLSDVLGDNLSAIASGPTVPDETTYADAIKILKEKKIWQKTPINVQQLLVNGLKGEINETPKANELFFTNASHTLVGSNAISLNALVRKAEDIKFKTDIFSNDLSGEAKDVADQLALYAKKQIENGLKQPLAILAGGETTVTLNKNTCEVGKGGRNQEMALAFCMAAEKYQLNTNWVFLSGGTDGRDGPTDAAGGMVDPGTLIRLKAANETPQIRLNNNDSYSALKKSKDLVITGATGTNVADLQILLIQPE